MKYFLVVNLEKTGIHNNIVYTKSPMGALLENNRLGHGKGKESEVIAIFELKDGINLIEDTPDVDDDGLPLTEMQKVAEYYRVCEQNGIDHVQATAGLEPAMTYAKHVLSDADE